MGKNGRWMKNQQKNAGSNHGDHQQAGKQEQNQLVTQRRAQWEWLEWPLLARGQEWARQVNVSGSYEQVKSLGETAGYPHDGKSCSCPAISPGDLTSSGLPDTFTCLTLAAEHNWAGLGWAEWEEQVFRNSPKTLSACNGMLVSWNCSPYGDSCLVWTYQQTNLWKLHRMWKILVKKLE